MAKGSTQPLVGFIGAGNMARALAGGLIQNGWEKSRLVMADPDPGQRQGAEQALGIATHGDNTIVAAKADILVLAVKPQVLAEVSRNIRAAVQTKRPLVISIAAGVRLNDLAHWLGSDLPIVRVMPNTAALIGSGASGMYANKDVSDEQRNEAESILRAVGVAIWVDDESLMDVVTAVSGSGPAYFFLAMEALEEAAVDAGLPAAQARLLALETAFGAAKMALEGHEEPALLRQRVTSPGGTTEQAVRVLEERGIRRMFRDAVSAAIQRADELARLFGKKS